MPLLVGLIGLPLGMLAMAAKNVVRAWLDYPVWE
jgi:hypothetical protein